MNINYSKARAVVIATMLSGFAPFVKAQGSWALAPANTRLEMSIDAMLLPATNATLKSFHAVLAPPVRSTCPANSTSSVP